MTVLMGLAHCGTRETPTGEVYLSPTRQYEIAVQIGDVNQMNRDHEIFLRLFSDGDRLDVTRTGASAVMNYAVFWVDNRTVVLYSSDIGVLAWRVTTEEKLIPAPVDHALEQKAHAEFNKKMGR